MTGQEDVMHAILEEKVSCEGSFSKFPHEAGDLLPPCRPLQPSNPPHLNRPPPDHENHWCDIVCKEEKVGPTEDHWPDAGGCSRSHFSLPRAGCGGKPRGTTGCGVGFRGCEKDFWVKFLES